MITYQNTKTIYDLVQNAGKEHGDHVFLRYEANDVIFTGNLQHSAMRWRHGRPNRIKS